MITHLNLTCPINHLSYGIVGRNILKALHKLGTNVSLWPIGGVEAPPVEHELILDCVAKQHSYHKYANSVRLYHQFDMAQHVGEGVHIGYPIFELNKFKTNEKFQLGQMNQIFVCSKWAAGIIKSETSKESVIVPLGVDDTIFNENVKPADLGIPSETTVFMNIGKWEVRKGHIELIQAFNKAFTKADNVALVLHCKNPFYSAEEEQEWVGYAKTSSLGDKILIVDDRLNSQEEVAALMAAADCGVFPSRAEGWNLPLAEMMRMGKEIIATYYSAHTEFLTELNASCISIDELEDADDGKWFHSNDSSWDNRPGQWAHLGESQMEQLIYYMRCVHSFKQTGALGINDDGIETMKQFTWERTAKTIVGAY